MPREVAFPFIEKKTRLRMLRFILSHVILLTSTRRLPVGQGVFFLFIENMNLSLIHKTNTLCVEPLRECCDAYDVYFLVPMHTCM